MKSIALRRLAEVNPPAPDFDRIPDDERVLFLPLETVWADGRADQARRVPKRQVSSGYTRFHTGDIVSPKVTPTFQAGRSMIAQATGAGTTELHILRAKPGVDPRWIAYALRSKDFLREGVTAFEGVAGLQRVPQRFIEEFRVADVPGDHQRRIADFLDDRVARIDRLILARHRQLGALEEHFVASRRDAILGLDAGTGTVETSLAWAPRVGSSWRERRLSQMAMMGTGHTPSRSVPEYWEKCTIPWLTTSDVHRFRHDEIDALTETTLRISEVGLSHSAAVLHPAGTVALSRTASAGFAVLMDASMATSQDFVTWTPHEELSSRYLLHLLRVMRPFLLGNLAMGSTHKTIYFPDLMDLRVPVPEPGCQNRAVNAVEEAAQVRNACASALQAQASRLAEYKQSLITAAVTGEFDVTTASTRILGEQA